MQSMLLRTVAGLDTFVADDNPNDTDPTTKAHPVPTANFFADGRIGARSLVLYPVFSTAAPAEVKLQDMSGALWLKDDLGGWVKLMEFQIAHREPLRVPDLSEGKLFVQLTGVNVTTATTVDIRAFVVAN